MNYRSRGLGWAFKTTLIPAVFAVAGCGSNSIVDIEDELPEALFGTWTWMSATGGIAGQTITPETEGFERTLVISLPNRVELLKDGQTEVSTTFEFIPETMAGSAIRSAELLYALPLMGPPRQWVSITETGELVLVDPCCDRFAYAWERLP